MPVSFPDRSIAAGRPGAVGRTRALGAAEAVATPALAVHGSFRRPARGVAIAIRGSHGRQWWTEDVGWGRVPTIGEVAAELDAGESVADIAAWYGCSVKSVRNVAHIGGLLLPQARRRAQRARLGDRRWLRAQLVAAGRTASDVAEEVGCTSADVTAAARAAGLRELQSIRHPQLYEPGWLAAELAARRSQAAIAAEVGASTTAVRRAIRVLGITDRRHHGDVRYPVLHDVAWLRRRYVDDGATSTDLAAEIGCRPPAVLRALKRAGIERRPGRPPRRYPQLHDRDWLARRYLTDAQPARVLAAEIGCAPSSVRRALRRHQISVRGRPRRPQLRDVTWLRRRYVDEVASISELAGEVGCTPSAIRKALAAARIGLHPPTRRATTAGSAATQSQGGA